MGYGTTGFGTKFNAAEAMGQFRERMVMRKQRAASYLVTATAMRTPVGATGKLRGSISVEQTETGFNLWVKNFYGYFVHEGHLVGSRRAGRARKLRLIAKELRRIRKETGDDSLKARETEFRKAAKTEQQQYAATRAAGTFVRGNPFVDRTLAEERANVISILAGNS